MTELRLLADIGGTNVRFALQLGAGGQLLQIERFAVKDYASLYDAAAAYLALRDTAQLGRPGLGCFGIATAVTGDWVQMTNHAWGFSVAKLQAQLGLQSLKVINDFTALALALTALGKADWVQVGGMPSPSSPPTPHDYPASYPPKKPLERDLPEAKTGLGSAFKIPVLENPAPQAEKLPLALLGAGTGLGVSGVVFDAAGQPIPLAGEGGHTSLPCATADEFALAQWLTQRYGHASAERVLSGQGVLDAYAFYCERGHTAPSLHSAQAVAQAGLDHWTQHHNANATAGSARLALDTFCALLGSVAGNLALTLGARGGVFVGGGIVPKLLALGGGYFAQSPFRARFEAKGRFSAYLQGIPVYVIQDGSKAALLGAGVALA